MCQLTATNGVIAGGDWGEPNKPHTFRNWDHLQGITLAQQTALFAGTWYPGGDGIGTAAPIPAMTPVKSMLAGLTPEQAAALAVFDKVNAESFSGWFLRSSGMAFMEVESSFNPQAFREEPSGVASYGMMQVVDATAHGLGLVGDPRKMFDPAIGIFYGLKYAAQGWNFLVTHLGRPPTLTEWCEGYNEGYGAAGQGRRDPAYSNKWVAARQHWSGLDAGGQNVTARADAPEG